MSADEVIQELRPKLAEVPGIRAFMQNLPPIRIGGQLTKSQYQFTLQSPDTGELYRMAPLLEEKLRGLPGLQDVTSDLQIANPQVNVTIDRDKSRSMGVIGGADRERALQRLRRPAGFHHLRPQQHVQGHPGTPPQVPDGSGGTLAAVRPVLLRDAGAAVRRSPLTPGVGPLLVNHLGQLPSVTLSFNLRPGVALGDAVSAVDKVARATLPASITTSFQGTAQAFQASLKGLGILLLMAILVIYLVLGILYESFIHPLTILSGLPSAGLGALLALLLFRLDLNLYAFVGVIMLIGIVKKNAIMMIDFALEAERKEGKGPTEAILEGCLIRFRPIMMTTMAALMATLPIAVGYGAGGDSRSAMGIAVVGGLLFSQLITLYLTPVVYVTLDRFQASVRKVTRGSSSPR